jgi:PD-(D/E)XK nuclease superfamily
VPVQVRADVRHLDIAYEVMDHVFAVHNDMGRFFDESIYRDALAARLPQSRTEVLVEVYESAVSHRFGGDDGVTQEIDILAGNRRLGRQSVRLSSPDWAFKVTSIDDADLTHFEKHARRFLTHTALCGLHWINITRKCVTFSSIEK